MRRGGRPGKAAESEEGAEGKAAGAKARREAGTSGRGAERALTVLVCAMHAVFLFIAMVWRAETRMSPVFRPAPIRFSACARRHAGISAPFLPYGLQKLRGRGQESLPFPAFSPVPRLGALLGSFQKESAMDSFKKAHAFTSRWEGGFVHHPADPGGATNYGVSLRFLRAQGLDTGDIDGDGDIDEDDIRALTPALAARVLRRNFWDVFPLDNVKPLMAMVIYDTAVNMGVPYAKKMVQQALGVAVDGRFGPLTWGALKLCDDKKTAAAMCHIRRARYCELARSNPALSPFLSGWLRRTDALEEAVEGA